MQLKSIKTDKAPNPVGPYSQAMTINGMLFTSGQLGIDPSSSTLLFGIDAQTYQMLKNLSEVAKAAGTSLDKTIKTVIYLKDLKDISSVDEIYKHYFNNKDFASRSIIKVSKLPLDALVEIEAVIAL